MLRVPSSFRVSLARGVRLTCAQAVRRLCAAGRHREIRSAGTICAITAAYLKDRTSTQAPVPVHPRQPPPADPGMTALTVPEVRRLIAVTARPSPPGHAEHWSGWTRSHQARARWFHHRARPARDQNLTLKPLAS